MISNKKNTYKQNISKVIDSLISIITNPNKRIEESSYIFHSNEIMQYIIHLYLYKVIINKEEFLNNKNNSYKFKYNNQEDNNFNRLINLKNNLNLNNYELNKDKIIVNNEEIDSKWLISFLNLLLDTKSNNNILKKINICYTIPDKKISKLIDNKEEFLSHFTYYNITIEHKDNSKLVKDNNILILKTAAINYLKHLKQYKSGLEPSDSYLVFYNLLKNECHKQGFELSETTSNLLDINEIDLNYIINYIDDSFLNLSLNKQIHIIENLVWHSSNDINLLEQNNTNIDSTIELINLLNNSNIKDTYKNIKDYHTIKDNQILLLLITNKFINIYSDIEEIDYSLLDLTRINPKYMNLIYDEIESELTTKIKNLTDELNLTKKELEKFKEERNNIDKETLKDKYSKELERCVGNINKASINIGTINSKLNTISKKYELYKKELVKKYKNIDLYNHNKSIIKHIYNSILACSFYLKTNNDNLLDNIIIFEDYEKTENAFYLEVSYKDLLKISNNNIIKAVVDQNDLPKLLEE